MSSYGDPNAGYGRAQVPSDGYGYEYDDYDEAPPPPPRRDQGQPWQPDGGYQPSPGYGGGGYDPGPPGGGYPSGHGGYDPAPGGYPPASGGGYPPSPSGGGYDDGGYGGAYGSQPSPRASGSAAVGSAAVGSASVGRASVGRASVSGSASVPPSGGRARVRPSGPTAPDEAEEYEDGPGGPATPGGRARKGDSGGPAKSAKKRKRRKILLASFAAVIILMGTGAIAGTYFFDNVNAITPENLPNKQTTAVFAADGKTQLAQLGAENRVKIDVTRLKPEVQHALIAGEDKNFYKHHGVDFIGIARAAWNNFTSDETQGASTITQQYVKFATQDMDISYNRKLREAVLARKLEDNYTKDEILGFYLNTIPFGRGAIGVEKAALAYYGKGADKLTPEEAAVLGAVIRQPFSVDGSSGSPYDPEVNMEEAKGRWGYVLDMMVAAGWMDQATRDKAVYPTTWIKKSKVASTAEWGVNGPGPSGMVTGNVLNYVYEELKQWKISPDQVKTGGYQIITTIDPKTQKAAESVARRDAKDSVTSKLKPNATAAIVAIDPANGRVLAYYGGDQGTGHDYAGRNWEGAYTGGHPPGSTMKIYTLAAALADNYSLQSRWKSLPGKFGPYNVQNAGRKTTVCQDYCTLETSLVQSYNVPFFQVTQQIGADKVVQMAHKAGINMIWGLDGGGNTVPVDLTKAANLQDVRAKGLDLPVGYGQYGITVLDHASGLATMANGGVYNAPHFVLKVKKRDDKNPNTYVDVAGAGEKLKAENRIPPGIAADVTAAMEKVTASHGWSIDGGRDTASKTGTWELSSKSSENGHAWVVGYTKQIAVAVWVGNSGNELPLQYKNGTRVTSGNAPADIWNKFLDMATKGQPRVSFPGPQNVGSDEGGNGVSPTPSAPPDGGICLPLLPCPNGSGSPGTGNGNGDGTGGGHGRLTPSPTRRGFP